LKGERKHALPGERGSVSMGKTLIQASTSGDGVGLRSRKEYGSDREDVVQHREEKRRRRPQRTRSQLYQTH